jgi:CheY-like chemotaxis protein
LVIDDSSDERELYRRALHKNTDAHYDIIGAEDGEKGLVHIEEQAPDCILLDYSLPGHNGVEVLKSIH